MSLKKKNKKMKYWHKITAKEFETIKNKSVGWLMRNYKQPDWCGYPDAIDGYMGCWSLVFSITNRKEYKRISKVFCKSCEYYMD